MSLNKYLVQFCYELEDSSHYKRNKQFFYNLIENPHSGIRPYFDVGMIVLVISSVYLIIYEVRHDLGTFGQVFEWFAVSVFLLEYLLRLWLYSSSHKIIIEHYEKAEFVGKSFSLWLALKDILSIKWDYMTQPLAIIDLLAIIPSYRPLRFLRIFLLFRLFKLFRYVHSYNEFIKVLFEKRFEFYTIFIFIIFIVFTSASAIFFFEAKEDGGNIETFFDGIYWSLITLTTVGYGDITPQTTEGRVITMILVICGLAVLAFVTSIIVSAFNEKMVEMRENRVFAELEKKSGMHTILCGYGRMGAVVAEYLAKEKTHFVIIEPDPQNAAKAKRAGYLVIEGSAENSELLKSAGVIDQAEMILCLTGSDVVNVYITLTARYLNPQIQIISRANQDDSVRKLKQAGANHTVVPFKIVGLIAVEFIGQPVAFEAIHDILSGKHDIGLETITVSENGSLDGRNICDIDFLKNKLLLFGVITNKPRNLEPCKKPFTLKFNHFYFNPDPAFKLQSGDTILVIGHQYSIVHLKDKLALGRL
ncbi:MAG: potassium channel family protein [Gammaproteobacteria bacterium]|nr:potassium channel family protein [Gammaproteobacteria bacterium]